MPLRRRSTRVAAEHFAITADVYRALGIIGEEVTPADPRRPGQDKGGPDQVASSSADLGKSRREVLEICAYKR